jgi:hypothetical protein
MHEGRMLCEDAERDGNHLLQAKGCQRWPSNHQKLEERQGTDSFLQLSKEPVLLVILSSDFELPELRNNIPAA